MREFPVQVPKVQTPSRAIEWPTLLVFAATYAVWTLVTTALWDASPVLAVAAAALAIGQFSSLSHEVLHGHPFRNQTLNEALVFPGICIFVPYLRFKDTHLQHHFDPALTDPYDDPESNYSDPAVWDGLPRPVKALLRFNNTLFGRMLVGPAIGIRTMVAGDLRLMRRGDRRVRLAWALHAPGVALVLGWLAFAAMPVWAYLLSAYLGWSLLKIRTYLEHRAHEAARARTVIIESRGPLALLFLNNNFHVVHHMHPAVPWYRLPVLYFGNREHYLRRNDGYVYRDYLEIFRKHMFHAKDPVPHPVWPVRTASEKAAELRGGAGIVEERHAGLVAARH